MNSPTKPGDRVRLTWWNGEIGERWRDDHICGTVFYTRPWREGEGVPGLGGLERTQCTVLLDRPLKAGSQTVARIDWCGHAMIDGRLYTCTGIGDESSWRPEQFIINPRG